MKKASKVILSDTTVIGFDGRQVLVLASRTKRKGTKMSFQGLARWRGWLKKGYGQS